MGKYPNVYYTIDALFGDQLLNDPGKSLANFLEKTEDFESMLEIDLANWKGLIEAYPDRFMWGTDRGAVIRWSLDIEAGQRWTEYARAFIGQLDSSAQEKFAYKNAENLLK